MADKKVNLRVISPKTATDRRPYKLQKDADMVILRCITGDLGILTGRMPCSMVLGAGILRILDDGKEYRMAVIGGVAHVQGDIVTVLTDTALLPKDIDERSLIQEISQLEARVNSEGNLEVKNRLKEELKGLRIQLEVAITS